jgi:universal stress protein E
MVKLNNDKCCKEKLMAEFKNILVVIDPTQDEQPALDRAVKMGAGTKDYLHAFLCDYPCQKDLADSNSKHEAKVALQKKSHKRLDTLLADLGEQSFEIGTEVYWNQDWPRSVAFVSARRHCDLIIKAMSPERGTAFRFKSSDRYILRHASCPVLLARPDGSGVYKRVVVAVNLDSADEAQIRLNNVVVRNAKALAKDVGASLHLVSAYKRPINRMLLENSDDELALEALVSQTFDIDVNHVELRQGSPKEVILQVASRTDDVLVIGTRVRTGVSGALIGNTVEKVLKEIGCDILAVR